jgi:hypothetical protein
MYNVAVFTANEVGYSSSSSVISVASCVGISARTLKNQNLALAQNPASGVIRIRTVMAAGNEGKIMITVQNSLGMTVSSGYHSHSENGNYGVNIEELPNGIYFVAVENGNERYVKRLIVVQ